MSGEAAVLARVGTTRLEITTISALQLAVARYASFDAATVSALRHDATALWSQSQKAPPLPHEGSPERQH